MDRNPKQNPFAAFDDIVPKANPTVTSTTARQINPSTGDAFAGFSPSSSFGNTTNLGGSSASKPPVTGSFQPSRPVNQGNPSGSVDAFGFPITPAQQPKSNPFDAFASKPLQPSKPVPAIGSFDFTASSNTTPYSHMATTNQSSARSAAFDGFAPSASSNQASSRHIQDPFASIPTAPIAFAASIPQMPSRLTTPQPPLVDFNEQRPIIARNPFESAVATPSFPSVVTTIPPPPVRTQMPLKQPSQTQQSGFPSPAFQQSPVDPARSFAQSSYQAPPVDNSFSTIPASSPTPRVFGGASIAPPPFVVPRQVAVAKSPFDDFQPSSQSTPIIQQQRTATAPSFSNTNPFGDSDITAPVAHAQNPPTPTPITNVHAFSKAVVASNPSLVLPPTLLPTVKDLISPQSPPSTIVYNQAAKPLAIYQGKKKAQIVASSKPSREGTSVFNRRKDQTAIWSKPYFADLFIKGYFEDASDVAKSQSVVNVRQSIRTVRDSLYRMVTDKDSFLETKYSTTVARALELFDSGCEIFDRFPSRSGDNDKLYSFIDFLMQRIRGMPVGGVLLIPVGWLTESGMQKTIFNNVTGHVNKPPAGSTLGTECAAVVILHRCRGTTDNKDFNVTIVNTNNVPDSGFDYHAVKIDPTDGSLLHNLSFQFHNIDNERVYNTSFWLLLFKSGVHSSVKFGSKFIYERVLPYLTMMPVTHTMTHDSDGIDFYPLPAGGDKSGINCALECLRQTIRQQGSDELQASHLPFLVKWDILKSIEFEMTDIRAILPIEIDVIRMACRAVAKSAAAQVGLKSGSTTTTVSAQQLESISDTITTVNKQLLEMDERLAVPPAFTLVADERLSEVCDWPHFGRLRRDFDVEALAGDSPVAPIIRPVEMTLVPDRVTDFQGVACAMRHALNLCVLLANQRSVVRNSYTLRVCMLEHLFVRVIPLPLPITHKARDTECFWHAQPMRYETQADILRLLSKLSIHFATGSLSVKSTRSGDAVRMLTFACMATICDATLRKIASDIPSQSSLHYSGRAKGPIHPFGFELGTFEEESEYLKLSYPESAVARTQVLDYFLQMKKVVSTDHMLFTFEKGSECCSGEKTYIDQLCVQLGFKRGEAALDITVPTRGILQLHPEIGFFRDIVFMFKLVMVPTLEMLPEVKCWEPEEAVLSWGASPGSGNNPDPSYVVMGFGRRLECTHLSISIEEQQLKYKLPRGIFSRFLRYVGVGAKKPRSTPSQANPSILLGERVDTEDDILHIRNLPDFDGTLGAKDCELMLQYLTAPYMRIPLLLSFFSNEVRLKALRNKDMQEVLDAAMFEPGQWKCDYDIPLPTQIPAPERDHLCTPVGLLFNELVMSPNAVMASVSHMLERVVDMDSGKYSELGESILYVTRLAIRVEGYLLFLIRNKRFHAMQRNAEVNMYNGAYAEANVRGLRCGDDVLEEAFICQKKIRVLLEEKMFKVIARWIKKSKKDGNLGQACMLHAHLAFIHRNVEPEDLTPRAVFTMLASQIFLFNYYKYDLDIESESKKHSPKDIPDPTIFDLVIPNVELFGMFQRNRGMILAWLQKSADDRNKVRHNVTE